MKKIYLLLIMTFLMLPLFAQSEKGSENDPILGRPAIISIKNTALEKRASALKPIDFLKNVYRSTSDITFKQSKKMSKIDNLGFAYEEYEQFYKGVPVEFGKVKIHKKGGEVQMISGEYYPIKDLNITPKISANNAFSIAKNYIGATKYAWEVQQDGAKTIIEDQSVQHSKPTGKLVVFPVYSDSGVATEYKLAYLFSLNAVEPIGGGVVHIDANTGEILQYTPNIKHAHNEGRELRKLPGEYLEKTKEKNLVEEKTVWVDGQAHTRYSGVRTISTSVSANGYYLYDSNRNIHTKNANRQSHVNYATDFFDSNNIWEEYNNTNKDNAALDAHWGAATTWDFYQSLSRDSYDGAGAKIVGYVHYGVNQQNASWVGYVDSNGNQVYGYMVYGDGEQSLDALTSLDIVGHELGHALMGATAALVYEREPGALNEGFSDIWAAAIEHYGKGDNSQYNINDNVWLIAEEIDKRAQTPKGIRSMSNPNRFQQPDTYKGTYWENTECGVPNRDANDYCGVHTNSGVLNYWFYLASVGGYGVNDVGNSYFLDGTGIVTMSQIAYRALVLLSENSKFVNVREATIQSAIDYFGAGSKEEQEVTMAWYAVNVGEAYPNYEPEYCASHGTEDIFEYVKSFSLNTINNTSGSDGYKFYRNVTTSLEEGNNYNINIQIAKPLLLPLLQDYGYAVWIDYNNNKSFEDTGEKVLSGSGRADLSQTLTVNGNFTVPQGVGGKSVRIRVAINRGTVNNSCETYAYGEVEDYMATLVSSSSSVAAKAINTQKERGFDNQNYLVYPNPANTTIKVASDNNNAKNYEIYNILGQMVQKGIFTNTIDISKISSGNYYILNIYEKNAVIKRKFVKQ